MDNNDFILKIVAELEEKGIKTGFDKLKKELEKDPAKIDVILDTSGTVGKTKGSIKKLAAELHNELSVEISKLQKQGQDINFDLSVGDVEEVIQNIINHTKKLGESFDVASDKAQKFLAKFNKKSGGVLINSDEFKAVQDAINGLGNTHTIEDLNKAMNTLEVTYDNMSSKLRNSGKSLNPFINAKNEMATMDKTIEGISLEFDKLSSKPDDVANAIKDLSVQQDKVNSFAVGTMEWADAYGHLQGMIRNVTKDISNLQKAQSSKSLQPRIDEIQLSMTGKGKIDYNWQVDDQIAKLKNLGFTEDEVAQKVKILTESHTELKRVIDSSKFNSIEEKNKAIIESDKQRTLALNQVKNAYKELKTDTSQYYNLNKQTRLSTDIQNWLSKNSRASKEAKESLNAYYKELSGGRVSVDRLSYIEKELKNIDAEQRGLGKLGKNLTDQFREAGASFTQWLSVSSGVMALVYQLQKIPKEVYNIDTAMTNLYKVTDETNKKYKDFLSSTKTTAFEVGRSISSLVDQTADWAKLGFDIDTSAKLAKTSSIYANVGEVDDETAVKDIVTAIKAFNIEAENSITIVDSLNKLGNEFATDAKSLGEGLRNSASSMAVAGNDINQTLAILTGGGEITQNVGELANGLRVVSMRLRGMKGELQDIGEEYEDIDSVSKIQTQIYNLTKGYANIFKDDGSFKSTYDQLREIAEVYFDLSDPDRADLTEIMFGKNRANQGVAILQAFKSGQIQKAYEASANAAGSAMEEQERWMGSLEAKTQQFEAAFQSLSSTVLDSDLLKWFVDFGIGIVKTFENTIEKLGSLGTIATGAGLFAGLKNVGRDKMYSLICYLF